jgi:peptidoglycan/xylan/chitin deacetylase (PgdA/CDA1 family)
MRTLRTRRSAVLCYHGVGPSTTRIDPGFLRVEPAAFRAQLDLLLEAGFEFVTVAEFVERAAGGRPPPGLIALSFDDGMDDNHEHVLPILRERGLPATVYVTTGLIGKRNPWMARDSGARMMSAEELGDLVLAGFEVGAHTVTHPDLSQRQPAGTRAAARCSCADIRVPVLSLRLGGSCGSARRGLHRGRDLSGAGKLGSL